MSLLKNSPRPYLRNARILVLAPVLVAISLVNGKIVRIETECSLSQMKSISGKWMIFNIQLMELKAAIRFFLFFYQHMIHKSLH